MMSVDVFYFRVYVGIYNYIYVIFVVIINGSRFGGLEVEIVGEFCKLGCFFRSCG